MPVCFQVSDDGRYVLLSIREGCDPVNRLWYCDLNDVPQGITGTDAQKHYYSDKNTSFLLQVSHSSLNDGRFVAMGEADR